MNQIFIQTYCFKNLCTTVTLNSGNSHFRKDLIHAFADGFEIILICFFTCQFRWQSFLLYHLFKSFKSQIRIYRSCSVTYQQAKMCDFTRFSGFNNYSYFVTITFQNQVMVYCCYCQKCRNWNLLFAYSTVTQNKKSTA